MTGTTKKRRTIPGSLNEVLCKVGGIAIRFQRPVPVDPAANYVEIDAYRQSTIGPRDRECSVPRTDSCHLLAFSSLDS
jgi:hypothetical protein